MSRSIKNQTFWSKLRKQQKWIAKYDWKTASNRKSAPDPHGQGRLWRHFGAFGSHFRRTLGTLWGHWGVTWGVPWHIFGVFSDRFGQIRVTSTSLWLWTACFTEIHIFPIDFNDFLISTARSILTFWSLWDHFGIDFDIGGRLWTTMRTFWSYFGSSSR